MTYGGLFFVKNRRAMQGLGIAPYHIIGKHALSASETAADGGAIAFAVGRLRNGRELAAELLLEGIPVDDQGGISALALGAYRKWGED